MQNYENKNNTPHTPHEHNDDLAAVNMPRYQTFEGYVAEKLKREESRFGDIVPILVTDEGYYYLQRPDGKNMRGLVGKELQLQGIVEGGDTIIVDWDSIKEIGSNHPRPR